MEYLQRSKPLKLQTAIFTKNLNETLATVVYTHGFVGLDPEVVSF